MKTKDKLQTVTHNLSSTHIGLCIEYLNESKIVKQWNKHSLSSIIHGFIGLESYVNFLAHELFFNEESHLYLQFDRNSLPIKKMLISWNATLPILDKIEYILSLKSIKLSDKLKHQLMELNSLRNWLIHGFSYKTTYLLEPKNESETSFSIVSMEDSVNWKNKFPQTKFNSIGFLNSQDAEIAAKIALEVLKVLVKCYKQPILVLFSSNKLEAKAISHENDNDIYELLGYDKKK